MDHHFTAEYENIMLRPLQAEDIEHLRAWRNNPENTKHLRNIGYITPEMQKKWFENYLTSQNEITFAIIETAKLHRLIGSASLYDFNQNQAEFGKILIGDEQAHGCKAGLHTVLAILKIGFEELHLDQIILHVYENNIPALRVYQQAGFEKIDSAPGENGALEYKMMITSEMFHAHHK